MSQRVGVFYYIEGVLRFRSKPLAQIDMAHYETLVSFSSHFTFWFDILRKEKAEWLRLDDSYFPRGRVYYDNSHKLFKIYCDTCIPDGRFTEIMAEFGIFPENGIFIHGADPKTGIDHYKCAKCDPDNRRKVL